MKLTWVFLAYRGVTASHSIIIDEAFSRCDVLRDLVTFVQFKKREKHLCTGSEFFYFTLNLLV